MSEVHRAEVTRVLDSLVDLGIPAWVAGGWGVDALHGQQTRKHRDLDLLVDSRRFADCIDVLESLGYLAETDWLPVRLELVSDAGWVDVHPLEVAPDGSAVQAALDGATLDYPVTSFEWGVIGDRRVACLSRAQQITFHEGYTMRPQDEHDLAVLRALPAG